MKFLKYLLLLLLFVFSINVNGATVNITSYGASGDVVKTIAYTTGGSATIQVDPTNDFTSAVGKLALVFGVGPLTTTATNYEDLIATVISVTSKTNITLSKTPQVSSNGAYCIIGTNNTPAFQACIDASPSNTVIYIPNGIYLLMNDFQLSNGTMSGATDVHHALYIGKGGLTFLGEDKTNTVLMNNGAFRRMPTYVHRGTMIICTNPVVSNNYLTFNNMTFDGGVQYGNTGSYGFPANQYDGDGWDQTHAFFRDFEFAQAHTNKFFTNCIFKNFRGELFISNSSYNSTATNNFNNCEFYNGNASALNLSFTYNLHNVIINNFHIGCEFYMAYNNGISIFDNVTITNVSGAFALTGAETANPYGAIIITNSTISSSVYGILLGPAKNVTIINNKFYDTLNGIQVGGAYQGTDHNYNINVIGNIFTNVYQIFYNYSTSANRVDNCNFINNSSYGTINTFGYNQGYGTNNNFKSNYMASGTYGLYNAIANSEQFFIDDAFNNFTWWINGDYTSSGQINYISYSKGMRHRVLSSKINSIWALETIYPTKLASGIIITVKNETATPIKVYTDSSLAGNSYLIANNQSFNFVWKKGTWIYYSTDTYSSKTNVSRSYNSRTFTR